MAELRIGYQGSPLASFEEIVETAVSAERAGFDVFTLPDLGGGVSPTVVLTAVARATSTIRVSPFVINAGIWSPGMLARDFASIERASGGRVDIALGTGIPAPSLIGLMPEGFPGRFERLRETVKVVKASFEEAGVGPKFQGRPPILISGTAERVLKLVASDADGFILAGVPPVPDVTLPRGQQVLASRADTLRHIDHVRELAGERADQLEICIGATVFLTDDIEQKLAELAPIHSYIDASEIRTSSKVFIGNPEQVGEQIAERVRDLGVTYHVLRGGTDPESLAPAVARAKALV